MVLYIIHFVLNAFQKDAAKQREILEKEIQDSMDELDKISPLYEGQVKKEKDITKRYAIVVLVY